MSTSSPQLSSADVSTSVTRIALRIAAVVWAAIAGLAILGTLITTVQDAVTGIYAEFASDDYVAWFTQQLIALAAYLFAWALPVAVGVFVSLRFFAPVAGSSPVPAVMARGVVAAVVGAAFGAILTLPLSIVLSNVYDATTSGGFLGSLVEMARRSVEVTPLILLIGLLAWVWMRRSPAV